MEKISKGIMKKPLITNNILFKKKEALQQAKNNEDLVIQQKQNTKWKYRDRSCKEEGKK